MTQGNRLAGRLEGNKPALTGSLERLRAHCDWLNGMEWVKATGKPYFIGQRVNAQGQPEHYLDRRA